MRLKIFNAIALAGCIMFCGCSKPTPQAESRVPDDRPSQQELIARGKYLATISGCNDCHSPKVMTAQGPVPDTTRLLSGHPREEKLSPIIKTDDWILFSNGSTASAGPWGVSFAANLTPHETGIGSWKYEQFVKAIRDGKSKGLEGSRTILPPMPWQMYRSMTDDDLKAIFSYLKSLPPVDNVVPAPIPPNDLISQTK